MMLDELAQATSMQAAWEQQAREAVEAAQKAAMVSHRIALAF